MSEVAGCRLRLRTDSANFGGCPITERLYFLGRQLRESVDQGVGAEGHVAFFNFLTNSLKHPFPFVWVNACPIRKIQVVLA
jgi:hypothetical protein